MKKVLLITPEFFQYYKYITRELEALENPLDREVWQVTVDSVVKSWK